MSQKAIIPCSECRHAIQINYGAEEWMMCTASCGMLGDVIMHDGDRCQHQEGMTALALGESDR